MQCFYPLPHPSLPVTLPAYGASGCPHGLEERPLLSAVTGRCGCWERRCSASLFASTQSSYFLLLGVLTPTRIASDSRRGALIALPLPFGRVLVSVSSFFYLVFYTGSIYLLLVGFTTTLQGRKSLRRPPRVPLRPLLAGGGP